MLGGRRWDRGCVAALLAACTVGTVHAETGSSVRQIWQLLDYTAVDYGGAVAQGAVSNESEYREMREFAATAHEHIAQLPEREGKPTLLVKVDRLQVAIAARAPAGEVAHLAREVADALLLMYPIPAAPATAPDLARGSALYALRCVACHGLAGHGDGPAARSLQPPPTAFSNASRARERSVFSLYQTISQGVSGTSMPDFGSLSDADRWALAFHVGGLSYTKAARQEGEQLWKQDAALRTRLGDLETLSRVTETELATEIGQNRARSVLAYVRAHPSVLGSNGVALARRRLNESVRAYRSGDAALAGRLALSAYLDGFEQIEPQLAARDAALLARVESQMGELRARITRRTPPADVVAQAQVLNELFERCASVLANSSADVSAAFLGSFMIVVREGLEALLIVVAIIAFLTKAGRRDVMPYVHGGWISALAAGVLTWGVATFLVSISGAGRELTEGYSSLFAATVLLSVGLWMHQKSLAGRWQHYINERLSHVLKGRSAWMLAGLAFVAVYREVFETILFYAALWKQGDGSAVVAGLAAGVGVLAVIASALLRFSVRLPIAKFFSISSIFIAVLAVILTGQGVAALQEAGTLQVRPFPLPRVSVLGIYPTVQTLLAQFSVLALAVLGFVYNAYSGRQHSSGGRPGAAAA
jgi:high-affinity iron transporter